VKLLYFAWVRQKLGRSEEDLPLPAHVSTVGQLADFLCGRGDGYAAVFSEPQRLRAAVNQAHVNWNASVRDEDEVAFFPPVTGG
jgi:molybdopterin synthase sulfur carrier subunit